MMSCALIKKCNFVVVGCMLWMCSKFIVSECNVVASAGGRRHPAGMQGGQQGTYTVVSIDINYFLMELQQTKIGWACCYLKLIN